MLPKLTLNPTGQFEDIDRRAVAPAVKARQGHVSSAIELSQDRRERRRERPAEGVKGSEPTAAGAGDAGGGFDTRITSKRVGTG